MGLAGITEHGAGTRGGLRRGGDRDFDRGRPGPRQCLRVPPLEEDASPGRDGAGGEGHRDPALHLVVEDHGELRRAIGHHDRRVLCVAAAPDAFGGPDLPFRAEVVPLPGEGGEGPTDQGDALGSLGPIEEGEGGHESVGGHERARRKERFVVGEGDDLDPPGARRGFGIGDAREVDPDHVEGESEGAAGLRRDDP